jgi:hypothetical protein
MALVCSFEYAYAALVSAVDGMATWLIGKAGNGDEDMTAGTVGIEYFLMNR